MRRGDGTDGMRASCGKPTSVCRLTTVVAPSNHTQCHTDRPIEYIGLYTARVPAPPKLRPDDAIRKSIIQVGSVWVLRLRSLWQWHHRTCHCSCSTDRQAAYRSNNQWRHCHRLRSRTTHTLTRSTKIILPKISTEIGFDEISNSQPSQRCSLGLSVQLTAFAFLCRVAHSVSGLFLTAELSVPSVCPSVSPFHDREFWKKTARLNRDAVWAGGHTQNHVLYGVHISATWQTWLNCHQLIATQSVQITFDILF